MKAPPAIVVQLVHLQGPLKGQIQEFTDPVIIIGRQSSSHLRFPPDCTIISRKHAEIQRDGNRFKLVDFSTNGTFVNGKKVTEAYLKNGDVLTLAEGGGPKVSFLTRIEEGRLDVEPPTTQRHAAVQTVPNQELPGSPTRMAQTGSPSQPRERQPQPPAQVETAFAPLVLQYGPVLRSFKQLPITVGKHAGCHFKIEHPAVLDMHTQIFFSQNHYWVKDLTGRGAVMINGQPIGTQAALRPNDLLALSPDGPTFRFLGEGRLAEEEQAPIDPGGPAKADPSESRQNSSRSPGVGQDRKSLFKRLF